MKQKRRLANEKMINEYFREYGFEDVLGYREIVQFYQDIAITGRKNESKPPIFMILTFDQTTMNIYIFYLPILQ